MPVPLSLPPSEPVSVLGLFKSFFLFYYNSLENSAPLGRLLRGYISRSSSTVESFFSGVSGEFAAPRASFARPSTSTGSRPPVRGSGTRRCTPRRPGPVEFARVSIEPLEPVFSFAPAARSSSRTLVFSFAPAALLFLSTPLLPVVTHYRLF